MRVSELAKRLEITSREVLEKAKELNIDVTTASSGLKEEEFETLKAAFDSVKNENVNKWGGSSKNNMTKKPTIDNNEKSHIRMGRPVGKAKKKDETIEILGESRGDIKSDETLIFEIKDSGKQVNKKDLQSDKKFEQKSEKTLDKTNDFEKVNKENKDKSDVDGKLEITSDTKTFSKEEKKNEVKSEDNGDKNSKKFVEEKKHIGPVIVKRASEVEAEEQARKEAAKKREEEKTQIKKEAGKKFAKDNKKDSDKKHKNNNKENKDRNNKEHNDFKDRKKTSQHYKNDENKPNGEGGSRRKKHSSNEILEPVIEFTKTRSRKAPQKKEELDVEREIKAKKVKKKDGKRRDKYIDLVEGSPMQYGEISLEKREKKRKKNKVKEEIETTIEETLEVGTKLINVPITVAGFCEQVGVTASQAIMALMKLGIVTNINGNLDEDTVLLLADDLGIKVVIGAVEEEVLEEGIEDFVDREEDLVLRSPIITVMGHVDHGKTSLLDAIRATNVTAQESGGITQHIGASEVKCNGQKIVFLDTPGHEAFTAMRARGADITDIAVLVVAADDSVKPQTVESISHAKAAGVPIIVAMNKMDKPGANPQKVMQDLSEHGLLVEDWGGDVICVPVSAKTGDGIDNLLEMILLQAEVLELKANPKRKAMGTVIEARLDKAKGPVATLLVTNGSMSSGMSVVVGTTSGRIRLMTDFKGSTIKKAGPATAVEILGLSDVPAAGDDFNVVEDDKIARDIAESRKQKQRQEVLTKNSSSTLEELFSQIEAGKVKELNLIIKADVRGSVGAIIGSLEKLSNDEVKVRVVHSGVGTVTDSDITLASTSGAIIIGFNVRPSASIIAMADRENVQIRTYRVIYNIIDDIENAMKGMLDPEYKEVVLGQVEIRETFKVPGVGTIGGAYVTDGKVVRNAKVRIVRDGIVIHEGTISSLKRFKDDAREVAQGYECGIGIERYNDIKQGDVVECFEMQEIERE